MDRMGSYIWEYMVRIVTDVSSVLQLHRQIHLIIKSSRGPLNWLITPWSQTVKTKAASVVPANPPILDGVNDLTSLSYLNEPSILHDLQQRYQHDQVCQFARGTRTQERDLHHWPTAFARRPQNK